MAQQSTIPMILMIDACHRLNVFRFLQDRFKKLQALHWIIGDWEVEPQKQTAETNSISLLLTIDNPRTRRTWKQ